MSDIEDDGDPDWSDVDEDDMPDEMENEFGDFVAVEEVGQYNSIRQVISLKDNCLDCIIKNFDRFNNAYKASEDSALGRNLEFLQRVYSSQVIQSLSKKALLHDEHLDFLINEYLKEFDLRMFLKSSCSLKAIEKRIALVGHRFAKVSFKFLYYDDWEDGITELLDATICHLSNVEILHIPQICNDTTLRNISSFCQKLSELDIDGSSDVTAEGLKMLCKKHEEGQTESLIKVLSVRNINALDSAVTFLLNEMPHLEVLNCDNLPAILYSMHKEDLKNNTLNNVKRYNLTKLEFEDTSDNSKPEVLKVWAEVCPNIKMLIIANISTKGSLDLISRFSNLESLTVSSAFHTATENRLELNNLLKSNGKKFKYLLIDSFAFSASVLITSCPKLQKLVLTEVQFLSLEKSATKGQPSNKILQNLNELCLVRINFSDQYVEDSVATILSSSPNISNLSFMGCDFKNSEINTKLAKFYEDSTPQHISFFYCHIDIALLESFILNCSSLLSLTMANCENIRSDEVSILFQLRDTTGSLVKIVFENDESFSDEDEYDYSYNYSYDYSYNYSYNYSYTYYYHYS